MFKIDISRTHSQDPRFGTRELVDVALRALSPSLNDPSTAIEAINEIGTVLIHYTRACELHGPVWLDHGGAIWSLQPTYQEFVDYCFDQVILHSDAHPRVIARIHIVLGLCMDIAENEGQRQVLRKKRRDVADKLASLAHSVNQWTPGS